MTISEHMAATRGQPSGFDYLRLALAVSVIVMHTIPTCYGFDAVMTLYRTPVGPLLFVVVPAFFAVSGFLVVASFQRVNNIPVFITFRAVRILPALLCVVLISAFLLGPIVTVLPLGAYFTDGMTWTYLLGAIGFSHYMLPGVFSHSPNEVVNASLWTIPYEVKCYLLLPIFGVLTLLARPRAMGIAAIALNVGAFVWCRHLGLLEAWDRPAGAFVIACFFWGVVLYLNRERMLYSGWLCAGAMFIAYVSMWWAPGTAYVAPLPIAYASIYLGLQSPRKVSLVNGRDLSYGMYLYGYPVQQTIADLLPYGRIWYFNLVTSLVVTACIAWLSWTLVESNALARKGQAARFVDAARSRLQRAWRTPPARPSLAANALSPGSASAPLMRSGQDAA